MASIGNAFDSSKHDDMASFDPIPEDEYLVQVTKSDVKATKAGTGKYINLEFTVMNGEYKGRKIFTNLNIVNPNPITVEIAQKELATLCRALGKRVIQDTKELHGTPFLMKVRIKVDKKKVYPPRNEPTGYASASSGAVSSGGAKTKEPDFANEGGEGAEIEGDFEGMDDAADAANESMHEEEIPSDPNTQATDQDVSEVKSGDDAPW